MEMPQTAARLVQASTAVTEGAFRVIGADSIGGDALRVTLVRVRQLDRRAPGVYPGA